MILYVRGSFAFPHQGSISTTPAHLLVAWRRVGGGGGALWVDDAGFSEPWRGGGAAVSAMFVVGVVGVVCVISCATVLGLLVCFWMR
jgi:hypothetical protein